jgi:hypothetical protein
MDREWLADRPIDASTPRHLQRPWTGEPVDGRRVLVHCYHGLGDTVQFARFIAPLARVARAVDVWMQGPLVTAYGDRLAGLDCVVTGDTLAAHLAGSIGVPTWLLLHERADWRWTDHRADTPWYPSMRIARRRAGERWVDLVARVAEAIAREPAVQQYRLTCD